AARERGGARERNIEVGTAVAQGEGRFFDKLSGQASQSKPKTLQIRCPSGAPLPSGNALQAPLTHRGRATYDPPQREPTQTVAFDSPEPRLGAVAFFAARARRTAPPN